ncbi:MAG: hypothetical protein H0U52_06675, partial [Chloroflexi bacterium]|nr:hypothetical protein [Chloroflexota bacterium]
QLALTYDAAHVGGDVWSEELAWLRRAVGVLGHKLVAGELDIAPSTLTDALLERERKSIKGEWIAKIRQLSSDAMRQEWLRIVSRPLGYEPERLASMTPEEELRLVRELLKVEAPSVLRAIDKELGR